MTEKTEKIVCFRQTDDGRRIVLRTKGIGESPIIVKAKLIEKACNWGFFPVSGSPSGKVTSLSPQPHMKHFGQIQITSHDDPEDLPKRVSIATSGNALPPVVREIIKDAYYCARECETLTTGITS